MTQNAQYIYYRKYNTQPLGVSTSQQEEAYIYQQALQLLATRLQGRLLLPEHADFAEAARAIWYSNSDSLPALIVRCANAADVAEAVTFVRETQRWGLATTTGTVSGTGLSGLTLGGGIGWLMGKYGLTIDNVRSIDLVTADGRVLVASETEYADLFWGLRGGGGNFGIATAFELQLHVVGPVLAGKVVYPISKAREVLRWYREFTATAPDELTAYAALMSSASSVPVIAINMYYSGPLAQGKPLWHL